MANLEIIDTCPHANVLEDGERVCKDCGLVLGPSLFGRKSIKEFYNPPLIIRRISKEERKTRWYVKDIGDDLEVRDRVKEYVRRLDKIFILNEKEISRITDHSLNTYKHAREQLKIREMFPILIISLTWLLIMQRRLLSLGDYAKISKKAFSRFSSTSLYRTLNYLQNYGYRRLSSYQRCLIFLNHGFEILGYSGTAEQEKCKTLLEKAVARGVHPSIMLVAAITRVILKPLKITQRRIIQAYKVTDTGLRYQLNVLARVGLIKRDRRKVIILKGSL